MSSNFSKSFFFQKHRADNFIFVHFSCNKVLSESLSQTKELRGKREKVAETIIFVLEINRENLLRKVTETNESLLRGKKSTFSNSYRCRFHIFSSFVSFRFPLITDSSSNNFFTSEVYFQHVGAPSIFTFLHLSLAFTLCAG